MALIIDPDNLSQGAATASAATTITFVSVRQCNFTATATMPALTAGDFFAVRNASTTQNNGLWVEDGGAPTTSAITASKVSGAAPITGVSETHDFLGSTATPLNVHWDVALRTISLIEQNGLDADGVLMQILYSKAMIDWKDDAYLIANAPFPMTTIDADAGKYLVGQDPSGNFSGWSLNDDTGNSIRTRKLLRNGGWTEYDSTGNVLFIRPGLITLGNFEDETPLTGDLAFYQFGSDTEVDDTVDVDFTGPVNEPVIAFERLADGSINTGGTGVAINVNGRTLTRSDGGNWSTDGDDGFKVGGRILLRNCENTTSDGDPSVIFGGGAFKLKVVGQGVDGVVTVGTDAVATANGFDFTDGGGGNDSIDRNDSLSWLDEGYFVGGTITSSSSTGALNDFTATILTLTASSVGVATATIAAATDDNTAVFGPIDSTSTPDTLMDAAIDNRNALKLGLRVRDADTNGKTFSGANLGSAGKTQLGGLAFSFPLANVTDLKITALDATIVGSGPYTGMTLTSYAAAQSLGGSGADELVGGPYNFGFVVVGNDGTDIEVFEWIQHELRQLTDIDSDGGNVIIGRTLDLLARFLGDSLELGSADGGLSFPTNPQGGGSGVMVTGLNASSRNTSSVFDNTGTKRTFPIGTTVTLDFNQTLIDDTLAEYTLYYDRTIRTTVADMVVNAGGTITSAGTNLPGAGTLDAGDGAYIRISGMAGADAPANGVYQVLAGYTNASFSVVRYDGAAMITTTVGSFPLDEHPIDSPDNIIVQTNVPADVQGLASGDYVFTYDYSNNVQGGASGGEDKFVVARAVGQTGAQYTQSSVQTIGSGVALTIPVSSNIERNFDNP